MSCQDKTLNAIMKAHLLLINAKGGAAIVDEGLILRGWRLVFDSVIKIRNLIQLVLYLSDWLLR